jgi:hypothetical protein
VPIEGYAEVTSLGISNRTSSAILYIIACSEISSPPPVLLLLRVHALYGRSRKILVLLVIFYSLTYISILSTATLALVHMIPQLAFSPLAGICAVDQKPVTLQAVWAAPVSSIPLFTSFPTHFFLHGQLGFEIVIFGMTLYKCLEHAKSQQLHTPLLHTLYRDGFLYFLVSYSSLTVFVVA